MALSLVTKASELKVREHHVVDIASGQADVSQALLEFVAVEAVHLFEAVGALRACARIDQDVFALGPYQETVQPHANPVAPVRLDLYLPLRLGNLPEDAASVHHESPVADDVDCSIP